MYSVRGKIVFEEGKPSSIPDGSILTVKVEDCNLMDTSSINLGTYVKKISGYNGEELTYEVKNVKEPPKGPQVTLSAVLNMGWEPHGSEWLRKGDYLNDTRHAFLRKDRTSEYSDPEKTNITIKKY